MRRFYISLFITVILSLGFASFSNGVELLNDTFSNGTYKTPPTDWFTSSTGNTDAGSSNVVMNFGTQHIVMIAKFTNTVVDISRLWGISLSLDYNPQSADALASKFAFGLVQSTTNFPVSDNFTVWNSTDSGEWMGYKVSRDPKAGGSYISVQNDSNHAWHYDDAADDTIVTNALPEIAPITYSGLTRSAQMNVYLITGSKVRIDYYDSTLDDPNLGTPSTLISSAIHTNGLGDAITSFDSVAVGKAGYDNVDNKGRVFFDNIIVNHYYIPPSGMVFVVK